MNWPFWERKIPTYVQELLAKGGKREFVHRNYPPNDLPLMSQEELQDMFEAIQWIARYEMERAARKKKWVEAGMPDRDWHS